MLLETLQESEDGLVFPCLGYRDVQRASPSGARPGLTCATQLTPLDRQAARFAGLQYKETASAKGSSADQGSME